jgi:hypothetical protein
MNTKFTELYLILGEYGIRFLDNGTPQIHIKYGKSKDTGNRSVAHFKKASANISCFGKILIRVLVEYQELTNGKIVTSDYLESECAIRGAALNKLFTASSEEFMVSSLDYLPNLIQNYLKNLSDLKSEGYIVNYKIIKLITDDQLTDYINRWMSFHSYNNSIKYFDVHGTGGFLSTEAAYNYIRDYFYNFKNELLEMQEYAEKVTRLSSSKKPSLKSKRRNEAPSKIVGLPKLSVRKMINSNKPGQSGVSVSVKKHKITNRPIGLELYDDLTGKLVKRVSPPVTFKFCGIKPGEKVLFMMGNTQLWCTVASDQKRVMVDPDPSRSIYSMSEVCDKFHPKEYNHAEGTWRGPKYFFYNNKNLIDIAISLGWVGKKN